MRSVINHQMMFGRTDISAIVFDPKCRDDMPKILRGLQGIYTNEELRKRVFAILEEVRPDRKQGFSPIRREVCVRDEAFRCAIQ
jgi:IS5 family transposase